MIFRFFPVYYRGMLHESGFISRLRQGETEAFNILYREMEVMLYNYILFRTSGNKSWSEEILSEIFIDAIDHASSLTPLHNIKAWLFRIAKSKIADHFRKLSREKKMHSGHLVENVPNGKGYGKNPETRFLEQEYSTVIKAAFALLSEEYQDILQKKYVEEMSVKEMSTFFAKSEKSIESILYRARKSLEKNLHRIEKERLYKGKGN